MSILVPMLWHPTLHSNINQRGNEASHSRGKSECSDITHTPFMGLYICSGENSECCKVQPPH